MIRRFLWMALGLLILGSAIGGLALLAHLARLRAQSRQSGTLPVADAATEAAIDPALVRWHQTASLPTGIRQPHALAVGPDGAIYVGGPKMVRRMAQRGAGCQPAGTEDGSSNSGPSTSDVAIKPLEITLDGDPTCLAIGGKDHVAPGRIYVGLTDHIEVFDERSKPVAVWKTLGEKAQLLSIAVGEEDVFAADAGNRIVWHFGADGQVKGKIGPPDANRRPAGFVITSPYFDLTLGNDGLLYVVNPRALRVEAFTLRGEFERAWGRGGQRIEEFCGCCNPAHLATLPDGRFVTAEKGILRVKVYAADGRFESVVAGPEQFKDTPADLATDRCGRVFVLDQVAGTVRVFEPKGNGASGGRP